MADFHAADLWVAVVPETSQVGPAMEKAGKEAKDKFGGGVKGIGKPINDELKGVGTQVASSMEEAGKKAKGAFHESVKGIGAPISDALRGGDISGAFDVVKDKMRGIEDVAKNVGIDLNGWKTPADNAVGSMKGVADQTKDGLKNITDVTSMVEGLPGKIGKAAAAFGEMAGVIASAVAISQQLLDKLGQIPLIHDRFMNPDGSPKSSIDQWADQIPPLRWLNKLDPNYHPGPLYAPFTPPPGSGAPLDVQDLTPGASPLPGTGSSGSKSLQDLLLGGPQPGAPMPGGPPPIGAKLPIPGPRTDLPPIPQSGADFYRQLYPELFGPSAPKPGPAPTAPAGPRGGGDGGGSAGGRIGGGDLSSRVLGGANSRQGLRAAGGQVSNLLAFAESLAGTPYSQELRNDCSGMVAKLANVALGLPPVASFSTVNEGDWLFSHGFQPGLGGPNDLNIGWYDHGGGNAGHTAATLPGGINAESGGSVGAFALGGPVGASSSQFTQHAHLSMGDRAGLGASGKMPTGAEHDPIYTAQSSTGGSGGAGSPFEQQGQQLGQGLGKGLLQLFGIDGSVMGGKSPLDWGAVKLGGGLLNYGMGLMNSMGGGPMGSPGMASGGGGGLGGLAGLIPGPGAMISAAAGAAGGSFGVGAVNKDVGAGSPAAYHDNRVIVANNNFRDQQALMQNIHEEQNRRTVGAGSGMPSGGPGRP